MVDSFGLQSIGLHIMTCIVRPTVPTRDGRTVRCGALLYRKFTSYTLYSFRTNQLTPFSMCRMILRRVQEGLEMPGRFKTCAQLRRVITSHLSNQTKALFLPAGYPDTVKGNYVRFSFLSALSTFLMSTSTNMSSTFLLQATGMSTGMSTALACSVNWILKDGIGQAGDAPIPSTTNVDFIQSHREITTFKNALCTDPAFSRGDTIIIVASLIRRLGFHDETVLDRSAGCLIMGRFVAHDFDLNTRYWFIAANMILCVASLIEVHSPPSRFLLNASWPRSIDLHTVHPTWMCLLHCSRL
jgi:hypothetical protein